MSRVVEGSSSHLLVRMGGWWYPWGHVSGACRGVGEWAPISTSGPTSHSIQERSDNYIKGNQPGLLVQQMSGGNRAG